MADPQAERKRFGFCGGVGLSKLILGLFDVLWAHLIHLVHI